MASILLIAITAVILAFKTALGIIFSKKRLRRYFGLFLLYLAAVTAGGLFVERISFATLAGFILKPNSLVFISAVQILIAIMLIIFGLRKADKAHIASLIPCPFTLVFFSLSISYFQKVISGINNLVISVILVTAYFFMVGLISITAHKSGRLMNAAHKAAMMLGFLFIALIFFLPALISNQSLISNGGGVMNTLAQILYLISNAHLVPVIIGLILLFCLSLVLLGRHLSEYLERKENAKKVRECWQILEEFKESNNKIIVPQEIFELFKGKRISGYLGKFLDVVGNSLGNELKIRKIIDDLELDMSHRVERMVLATRIGPMLGLMGTLIPMGPALTNLAAGNLGEMANQMVVAFATTVLGLTVSGVAYFISIVRRRWYLEELNNIEYLSEIIISHLKKDMHQKRSVDNGKEVLLETR